MASLIGDRWGHTIASSLLAMGVKTKMDLRLVSASASQTKEDLGSGEMVKECSLPKYFKDKRKSVIAAKALLNTLLKRGNVGEASERVQVPYIIVMGFQIHLCVLYFSDGYYVTKKIRTIAIPSSLNDIKDEAIELTHGLLDLVVSKKVVYYSYSFAFYSQYFYRNSARALKNLLAEDENEKALIAILEMQMLTSASHVSRK